MYTDFFIKNRRRFDELKDHPEKEDDFVTEIRNIQLIAGKELNEALEKYRVNLPQCYDDQKMAQKSKDAEFDKGILKESKEVRALANKIEELMRKDLFL